VPKRGGNKERHRNGECLYARHTVRVLGRQCGSPVGQKELRRALFEDVSRRVSGPIDLRRIT